MFIKLQAKTRRLLKKYKKYFIKTFFSVYALFKRHRLLSLVFKRASNFSIRHSYYIQERKIKAFIVLTYIIIRYLLDFIDFCCWLIIPSIFVEQVKGWGNTAFITPDFPIRHYYVLKILIEDWWFDPNNWVRYDDMVIKYYHEGNWHSGVFDFIFFT